MTDINQLEKTLAESLPWHKARINFLAKFLIAIIYVRTVNFSEMASVFIGKAKVESHYKRIQRFFKEFEVCYTTIAMMVIGLMGQPRPWILTLDRTNWKLGETNLNILTLGIVYRGVAFPVFWKILDKRGNSNTAERIELMEEFIELFGSSCILYLCADREFVGKQWALYLQDNQIDFRIRIKQNTLITNARGQKCNAWRLFSSRDELIILEQPRQIWGLSLYFSGMRLQTGEYLIVVAPWFSPTAIADYARRWEIETLFGCLKSRGFRLEETHLTNGERLKKLIAMLAIAFCWAHAVGQWLTQQKPIKIKKHGRLAKSIFRTGFDHLRRILTNFQPLVFSTICKFLSCT